MPHIWMGLGFGVINTVIEISSYTGAVKNALVHGYAYFLPGQSLNTILVLAVRVASLLALHIPFL